MYKGFETRFLPMIFRLRFCILLNMRARPAKPPLLLRLKGSASSPRGCSKCLARTSRATAGGIVMWPVMATMAVMSTTTRFAAGLLRPSDLAGYRNGQVFIRNSMHIPLNKIAVRDSMPAFFDLLRSEEHPAVRVVPGHFIFIYLHPYMDGNGRMGQFLKNTMTAAASYPWTVFRSRIRRLHGCARKSERRGKHTYRSPLSLPHSSGTLCQGRPYLQFRTLERDPKLAAIAWWNGYEEHDCCRIHSGDRECQVPAKFHSAPPLSRCCIFPAAP